MYLGGRLSVAKGHRGDVLQNGHLYGTIATVQQRDQRPTLHRAIGNRAAHILDPRSFRHHLTFVHCTGGTAEYSLKRDVFPAILTNFRSARAQIAALISHIKNRKKKNEENTAEARYNYTDTHHRKNAFAHTHDFFSPFLRSMSATGYETSAPWKPLW